MDGTEIKELIYDDDGCTNVKISCPYCDSEVTIKENSASIARCECGEWAVERHIKFIYRKRQAE